MTTNKVAADDFNIAAKSAMAVDATSGKILYEKDANTPIEVGSITNLLTVYLVYEAIDRGDLTADTYVDISDYAYNLTSNPNISNVPLEAKRYKVKDLIAASLMSSSNSANDEGQAQRMGYQRCYYCELHRAEYSSSGIRN